MESEKPKRIWLWIFGVLCLLVVLAIILTVVLSTAVNQINDQMLKGNQMERYSLPAETAPKTAELQGPPSRVEIISKTGD